ncbi:hypothetical protein ES703_106145 [subsurface metagenome]
MLSDMKESGDLEQDADLVLGIYREQLKCEIMHLGCLKGRDVPVFQGELFFDGNLQKVEDVATDRWTV